MSSNLLSLVKEISGMIVVGNYGKSEEIRMNFKIEISTQANKPSRPPNIISRNLKLCAWEGHSSIRLSLGHQLNHFHATMLYTNEMNIMH